MSDAAWIGVVVVGILVLTVVVGIVWGLRGDRGGYEEASFDGEWAGTLVEVAADIITALIDHH